MSGYTDADFERDKLTEGSYLCKPNDGYELDRREAQAAHTRIIADRNALKAELYARQTMLLEGAEPSVIDENAALKRQRNALKAEVERLRHWKHDRLNQESIEGFFPVQPFGCTERDSCIERSQAKCEWCMNSDTRLAAAEKVAGSGVCPTCGNRDAGVVVVPTGHGNPPLHTTVRCQDPYHDSRAEWEQTRNGRRLVVHD